VASIGANGNRADYKSLCTNSNGKAHPGDGNLFSCLLVNGPYISGIRLVMIMSISPLALSSVSEAQNGMHWRFHGMM
jgi:hypothetical protein